MKNTSNKESKKFLLQLTKFLTPLFIVMLILNYTFYQLPNSYKEKEELIDSQEKDIEVLVLGSSHPYQGINPAYFDIKGFNLANSGQDFYYDTKMVQRHIDNLSNLKMVIFTVSYHSFEFRIANQAENHRVLFYQRYHGVPPEKKGLIRSIEAQIAILNYQKSYFSSIFRGKNIFKKQRSMSDLGFVAVATVGEKNDQTGRDKIKAHHAEMNPEDFDLSYKYLAQTISLLEQRNIKVVLLSLPVYETYSNNFDPQKYIEMQEAIKKFQEDKNIEYSNYLFDKNFTYADFANDDHLNTAGAEKMSKMINQEIIQPTLK